VTIGVLDGVHLGHRALIESLRPGGVSTVLTFDPHPIEVLRPGTPPRLITTLDERLVLLEAAGVGLTGVLDLTEVRELDPKVFIKGLLVDKLSATSLTVGSDFRFGKDRAGDVALLEDQGREYGYEVDAIDLVTDLDEPISSSRIRALIESGDVAGAAALLGSRYRISNEVVHGDNRGQGMGFPTANLLPPERKIIPGSGVYAAIGYLDGAAHMAAVNVGIRPTFGGGKLLIEAFLIDHDSDLYGRRLTIEFVRKLRPELEFDGVEALVARMREDVEESRQILGKLDPFVG
jgi:riboflavin kinase/FMN adenylyltransferase